MDEEEIKKFGFVRLKINLKNGLFYSGRVEKTTKTTVTFRDKFGNEILISIDSIASIQEVGQQ